MTKTLLFSGGEVHVKVSPEFNFEPQIVMTDYTMNGFMAVCLELEVRRRLHAGHVRLIMPYIPYARQDRVMEPDEPFSLKVFCEMLNSQHFDWVRVYDPHSDVAPALINNCIVVPQWDIIKFGALPSSFSMNPDVIFVSPDAGAFKKVSKVMPDDSRIAIGVKHRGPDGKITHTGVFSPVPLKGRHCVIIDDICDGGRTFIALATALREEGATHISLYVTHGIFSQGLDALTGIDRIFTTNSFPQKADPRLSVYNII